MLIIATAHQQAPLTLVLPGPNPCIVKMLATHARGFISASAPNEAPCGAPARSLAASEPFTTSLAMAANELGCRRALGHDEAAAKISAQLFNSTTKRQPFFDPNLVPAAY